MSSTSTTYAGNLESLASVAQSPRYAFVQADICDRSKLTHVFAEHRPNAVMNLAAESHVDRSIEGPDAFLETNLVGTGRLLQAALAYWTELEGDQRQAFRFLHVSTDEVFGDLSETDAPFRETTAYAPSSPYAATKAGSDHLVRASARTYELPILLTNCSNNYGPYQFPEKLIPHTILNELKGAPLPQGLLGEAADSPQGTTVFACRVATGQAFGVVGFDSMGRATSIEEILQRRKATMPSRDSILLNFRIG